MRRFENWITQAEFPRKHYSAILVCTLRHVTCRRLIARTKVHLLASPVQESRRCHEERRRGSTFDHATSAPTMLPILLMQPYWSLSGNVPLRTTEEWHRSPLRAAVYSSFRGRRSRGAGNGRCHVRSLTRSHMESRPNRNRQTMGPP